LVFIIWYLLFGIYYLGQLKGYWRLRVGDYRVIYKIRRERIEVLVIKVGMRRDEEAYKAVLSRINKLQENYFS